MENKSRGVLDRNQNTIWDVKLKRNENKLLHKCTQMSFFSKPFILYRINLIALAFSIICPETWLAVAQVMDC